MSAVDEAREAGRRAASALPPLTNNDVLRLAALLDLEVEEARVA